MENKKIIFGFVTIIIVGLILLVVGSLTDSAGEDLYNIDINNNFKFEANKYYFIDASHIEIIGDSFYSHTSTNKRRSTDYYYNAKITNAYNQEYYIIMVLNDGARTNMLNGKLKNATGIIHEVDSKIKDKQMQSLGTKGISGDVYNLYLDTPTGTLVQLAGVSLIITGIICTIILLIQSKRHYKKENSSDK